MIINKVVQLTFLFAISFFTALSGQIDTTLVIQSDVFSKERKVRVYLPESYLEDAQSEFAATYILYAQSDLFWDMAKGNVGYLVNNQQVLPMVLVGIVSDDRGSEFEPSNPELRLHFEKEVFPLIESTFRVKKLRTIIGHSWGGLFTGFTLFGGHHDLFDAYLSISPSMGYKDKVFTAADSLLKKKHEFRKFFYCTSGDVGRREYEFGAQVASMDSLIKKYPNPTLVWGYTTVPGTDHWSCVGPSLCIGLVEMSRNYWADQKVIEEFAKNKSKSIGAQIEAYTTERQEQFGFSHKSGSGYMRFIANDFEEMEQNETALELFDYALKLNPNNFKAHQGKAYVYKKLDKMDLALESYKNALPALEASKNEISAKFYERVKNWLEEKIASME